MPGPDTSVLEIDLGKVNGGKKRFDSLAALRSWISSERSEFSSALAGSDPTARELLKWTNQAWTEIDQALQAASAKREGDPGYEGQLNHLKREIEQRFQGGRLLASSSTQGRFVLGTAKDDALAAAYVLCVFLGRPLQSQVPLPSAGLKGAFLAFRHLHGVKRDVDADREALRKVQEDWVGRFGSVEDEWTGKLAELTTKFETLAQESREQADGVSKFKSDQEAALAKLLEEADARLKSVESFYDQGLALRRPVRYWKHQAGSYRTRSVWWGVAAGVCAVGVAGLLGIEIYSLLQTTAAPEYWKLGLLALTGTFGLWLVRILVRVFLSYLHLATDSGERAIMTQVYLSLLREEKDEARIDRNLVLAALFRPGSTGIVKEDSGPPSIWEMFRK